MSRFSLTAAVLLFSTAVAGAGGASPQASGAAGQNASTAPMQFFNSSEGHYSVMMPGTPVQNSEQAKLSGDTSITIYEFTISLANDNISFLVMYNDYPAGYAEDAPEAVLARTRDGAVKTKTLNSDRVIELTVSEPPIPRAPRTPAIMAGAPRARWFRAAPSRPLTPTAITTQCGSICAASACTS